MGKFIVIDNADIEPRIQPDGMIALVIVPHSVQTYYETADPEKLEGQPDKTVLPFTEVAWQKITDKVNNDLVDFKNKQKELDQAAEAAKDQIAENMGAVTDED